MNPCRDMLFLTHLDLPFAGTNPLMPINRSSIMGQVWNISQALLRVFGVHSLETGLSKRNPLYFHSAAVGRVSTLVVWLCYAKRQGASPMYSVDRPNWSIRVSFFPPPQPPPTPNPLWITL